MRRTRGTPLLFVVFAGSIGCAQFQTHDSLASLLSGRSTPTPTPHITPPERGPNAVPREDDGRGSRPPYVIGVTDVLTIKAGVKDATTGATERLPGRPVTGTFVVRADGTVDLGDWGRLSVAGLDLDEASAVRKRLATSVPVAGDIAVTVDIRAANSKCYQVVVSAPAKGRRVYTFLPTWPETVLDAIANVDGLAEVATKASIRVVRKSGDGTEEVLPVDWLAITQNGLTKTNYELKPGDRVEVTHR
jgi:polysaccharide export outer membrane protein